MINSTDSKFTNVLNVEDFLIVEGGLVSGAELDAVTDPDGRVVLIEEALVWLMGAVVGTLPPLFGRGLNGSVWWRRNNKWSRRRKQEARFHPDLLYLTYLANPNILDAVIFSDHKIRTCE